MESTANTQDQLVRQVGGVKKPKPTKKPKKDILPTVGCKK